MGRRQTRSEARECAFSLIFQLGTNTEDPEFLIMEMLDEHPESLDNISYIRNVVYGVQENRTQLTSKIEAVLPENRPISRISKAVMSILLLAIYEIENIDDVPVKVAINEAIELAKKYAEDEAPSFVNGVLSGVVTK